MTGDESYHAHCFTCRTCKQRIEELVFAKTSQGIYCMVSYGRVRFALTRRTVTTNVWLAAVVMPRQSDNALRARSVKRKKPRRAAAARQAACARAQPRPRSASSRLSPPTPARPAQSARSRLPPRGTRMPRLRAASRHTSTPTGAMRARSRALPRRRPPASATTAFLRRQQARASRARRPWRAAARKVAERPVPATSVPHRARRPRHRPWPCRSPSRPETSCHKHPRAAPRARVPRAAWGWASAASVCPPQGPRSAGPSIPDCRSTWTRQPPLSQSPGRHPPCVRRLASRSRRTLQCHKRPTPPRLGHQPPLRHLRAECNHQGPRRRW